MGSNADAAHHAHPGAICRGGHLDGMLVYYAFMKPDAVAEYLGIHGYIMQGSIEGQDVFLYDDVYWPRKSMESAEEFFKSYGDKDAEL